jgi:CTP-dependent riboflavin kinase
MTDNALTLTGKLVPGLGEAKDFTAIPWVRQAFRERLGIDVHPGTVNLEIDAGQMAAWETIRHTAGVHIPPGAPGFCDATAWPVRVNGAADAAILLPHVDGYPDTKVELIADVSLRETLGIREGDVVTIVLQAADA